MVSNSIAKDIDQLRDNIWNYLYHTPSFKTIDEIATYADADAETVRTAVNHEWFKVFHDQVSVAYSPAQKSEPA